MSDLPSNKETKNPNFFKTIGQIFKSSLFELKSTVALTTTGIMGALSAVLSFFVIVIGDFIKIGFAFIPIGITSMLYGPVSGGIIGALSDILGYIIKPTGAYFPGFTLNGIVKGIIYGLFLYKKPLKLWRIIVSHALVTVICELGLSTLWLCAIYGASFKAIFGLRVIKCLIAFPVEVIMLYFLATLTKKLPIKANKSIEQ